MKSYKRTDSQGYQSPPQAEDPPDAQ